MAARASWRDLKASKLLWRECQKAYGVIFVWQGALRIERSATRQASFGRVLQGEGIGYSNALAHILCIVHVPADADSRLLVLSGDDLRRLVPKYPELAFALVAFGGHLVARLSDDIEALHHHDLEARLLRSLRLWGTGK